MRGHREFPAQVNAVRRAQRHDLRVKRKRDAAWPRRASHNHQCHLIEQRSNRRHLHRETAVRHPAAVLLPAFLEGDDTNAHGQAAGCKSPGSMT
jgi:hypothetical protein